MGLSVALSASFKEDVSFFFLKIFLMWIILQIFIEFVTILLLFLCFDFLAPRHVGF